MLEIIAQPLHLSLQLFDLIQQAQNYGYACEIYPKILSETLNPSKKFDVRISVQTHATLGPLRLDQPLALIEPQGLRMALKHPRYNAYLIARFIAFSSHINHLPRERSSRRQAPSGFLGSASHVSSNLSSISRCSSVRRSGTCTLIFTY